MMFTNFSYFNSCYDIIDGIKGSLLKKREDKQIMKKTALLIATICIASSLLFGCGTANTSTSKSIEKKEEVPSKPKLTIADVHIAKNDGKNLDVTFTLDNNNSKAIYIKLADFALISNSTTLSPSTESKVPAQIPANTKTNISLTFDVKDQLSGTVKPKIGFQPNDNQPQIFESLGNVEIPAYKEPVSEPLTSESTSRSNTSQNTSVTPTQATPSITYTTADGGTSIILAFHNLGSYMPTKLEMIDSQFTEAAIVNSDGTIAPANPNEVVSAWQRVDGNIQYWYHNYQFGSDTEAKVTLTAPGKNPITLTFSYKVPL